MKDIIIVAEDLVTRAILYRLIEYCCPMGHLRIMREEPARGGQIKQSIPKFNALAKIYPVVLLTDLDQYNCPLEMLKDVLKGQPLNNNFLLRIAVDEAESWLMSDREGFAKFLGIDVSYIPESENRQIKRNKNDVEIKIPYKPSLFMMRNLVPLSSNHELKRQLTPRDSISKGPEYNIALVPFIEKSWNIEKALLNSYSLNRTISRLKLLCS